MLNKLKIAKFEKQLEKEREKAQELYDKKGNSVICEYCGKLLDKNEAGVIYNFITKELTYHHDSCFEKYAHRGTLEDLQGVDKE